MTIREVQAKMALSYFRSRVPADIRSDAEDLLVPAALPLLLDDQLKALTDTLQDPRASRDDHVRAFANLIRVKDSQGVVP